MLFIIYPRTFIINLARLISAVSSSSSSSWPSGACVGALKVACANNFSASKSSSSFVVVGTAAYPVKVLLFSFLGIFSCASFKVFYTQKKYYFHYSFFLCSFFLCVFFFIFLPRVLILEDLLNILIRYRTLAQESIIFFYVSL